MKFSALFMAVVLGSTPMLYGSEQHTPGGTMADAAGDNKQRNLRTISWLEFTTLTDSTDLQSTLVASQPNRLRQLKPKKSSTLDSSDEIISSGENSNSSSNSGRVSGSGDDNDDESSDDGTNGNSGSGSGSGDDNDDESSDDGTNENSPSFSPSLSPSTTPSTSPSIMNPSSYPSVSPSVSPSLSPSTTPSTSPSMNPSSYPSVSPSVDPSTSPSITPSDTPSSSPSIPCGGPCEDIDNDPCTIEFCDTTTQACQSQPAVCGENEACDVFTGICQNIQNVVPCVAVIDEWDNRNYDLEWKNFRELYPQRPFCLLVPRSSVQRL